MGCRFEFNSANNILMVRMEGKVTDSVIKEADLALRELTLRKPPAVFVADCSAITKFAMSSEFIRYLAKREHPIPGLHTRRFIVAPSTVGFGLARMFQIAGEPRHPGVTIVRSLGEVFDALGIEPAQFEPLE